MSTDATPLAVVIPALNEESSIATVVAGLCAQPAVAFVIVVDNGSTDGTAARAARAGALVVHEPRRGYGAALRRGIEEALQRGARSLVLSEADGTFDPAQVEDLRRLLGVHELVLGTRRADLPLAMRWGNRIVAWFLMALWPIRSCALSDVGCTYRALRGRAWTALRSGTLADGPEFAPQMVCEAFRLDLSVTEIPVRYGLRSGGRSKHNAHLWGTLCTAGRMLRCILRKRLEAERVR
jgi:glycosyltransferase involved in cell wall biosynthesis